MVAATPEVKIPRLSRGTHPFARAWYRSLRDSSQTWFYEPSDWTLALFVAEQMTRLLNAPVITDEQFASICGAMDDLVASCADCNERRRRDQARAGRGEPLRLLRAVEDCDLNP